MLGDGDDDNDVFTECNIVLDATEQPNDITLKIKKSPTLSIMNL